MIFIFIIVKNTPETQEKQPPKTTLHSQKKSKNNGSHIQTKQEQQKETKYKPQIMKQKSIKNQIIRQI